MYLHIPFDVIGHASSFFKKIKKEENNQLLDAYGNL